MNNITVYILNKNYGKFIRRCIESLYKQTIKNYELIVIDDASNDNSQELLISLQRQYDFELILNQSSKGLIKNSNIALKKAKFPYIMRLDADDYLCEDALATLMGVASDNPSMSLIYGNYYLVDCQGNTLAYEKYSQKNIKGATPNYPAHGAVSLIKVESLRSIGGYCEEYDRQDGYYLWFKFIQSGFKISHIDRPLFYYTQHAKSLSQDKQSLLETRAKILSDLSHSDNDIEYYTSFLTIEHLLLAGNKTSKFLIEAITNEIEEALKFFAVVVIYCNNLEEIKKLFPSIDSSHFCYGDMTESLFMKICQSRNSHKSKSQTAAIRNFEYPMLGFHHVKGAIALHEILSVDTVLSCTDLFEEVYNLQNGYISPSRMLHMPSIERDKQKMRAGGVIVTSKLDPNKDPFQRGKIVGYDIDAVSALNIYSPLIGRFLD